MSFFSVLAADVTIGLSMKVDKFNDLHQPSVIISGIEITMSGSVMSDVVQLVDTNKGNIAIQPTHGTLGWVFMRNLDATNPVVYGVDADAPFGKLLAGEATLYRLDSSVTNLSVKALTNAVYVRAWVLDN